MLSTIHCVAKSCHEDALIPYVAAELAMRRMIYCLSTKVYREGKSQVRLTDAFSTWERYQETFLSTEDKKRAFVGKLLPGAEVEACTFLCQLLAGNSAIHEIVLAAVNEIFLMPAEMIFARPAWAKDEIIDLDCLLQPDEEKVEAPLQAAIAPEPAPASESGAAAQLQEVMVWRSRASLSVDARSTSPCCSALNGWRTCSRRFP